MKLYICFAFISTNFTIVNAHAINGEVVSKNNKGVEYAVVILQTQDSIYVNSIIPDSRAVSLTLTVKFGGYNKNKIYKEIDYPDLEQNRI